MLSSLTEVDERLACSKFQKQFLKIFNDYVSVIPLEAQTFKQTRKKIFNGKNF